MFMDEKSLGIGGEGQKLLPETDNLLKFQTVTCVSILNISKS